MIKMTEFLVRRPDLTREEFAAYWKDVHAPLVLAVPEVKQHTLRYVQQLNNGWGAEGEGAAPYDGLVEVWFEDADAFQAIASSPEFAMAVEDVANFCDVSKGSVMFTTEEFVYQP